MAESRPVDPFNVDFSTVEAEKQSIYRRLGLINGLLIGLALGVGAWGAEAWRIAQLPVNSFLPSLLLGLSLVVVLCGFVGWLTCRVARTPLTVLLWLAAAVISMLIMGYLPYYGRTLTVWVADARFWGRVVFPYTLEGSPVGFILGGLLIILVLTILGLLQNYRLENLTSEVSHRGRLNGRTWVSLLLPLPVVFLVSLLTQSVLSNPAPSAFGITDRAIAVAQNYEGDLRQLRLGDGISYIALRSVHGMIGSEYTLSVIDVNPLTSTVIVGADFANGAWVYCRVINDQLSFCYDASLAYVDGLRVLVTGVAAPEECRGCVLQATDEATAWLAERRDRFGADPAIEGVAQQGSHVLMRVTGDEIAAECWIEGVAPTMLMACEEVESGQ
jgi:hypothetical protein